MRPVPSKCTMVCANDRRGRSFHGFASVAPVFNPDELMKKLLVLLPLVFVLQNVSATSIYEPFADATSHGGTSYTPGSFLAIGTTATQSNATGGPWFCVSNTFPAAAAGIPVITNGNLSYPGLSASPGHS